MSGSSNAGDLLGGGAGRWAVALCFVVVLVALVPIGLTALGFSAIMAIAGGLSGNPSTGAGGQMLTALSLVAQAPQIGVGQIQQAVSSAPGLVDGWASRGAVNQYAQVNYRTKQSWLTWDNVDCSAAALDWLLGAYGRPVGSIDDAIGLLGPGTGISTRLGLLDARGPALAQALAVRGLSPRAPQDVNGRPRPLGSIGELEAWLDRGPLLMDGARWFGEGHWFVAIAYDKNGVYIRDSSGWDNRYLSWARLYGEAGFSGWVVGVVP